jgi:thermitase
MKNLIIALITFLPVLTHAQTYTYIVDENEVSLKLSTSYKAIQIVNNNREIVKSLLHRTHAKSEKLTLVPTEKSDSLLLLVDLGDKNMHQKEKFNDRLEKNIEALNVEDEVSDLPVLVNERGDIKVLPNEFTALFHRHISEQAVDSVLKAEKMTVLRLNPFLKNSLLLKYDGLDDDPLTALERSKTFDKALIKYITPNFIDLVPNSIENPEQKEPESRVIPGAPNDALVGNQWYLSKIGLLPEREGEIRTWDIAKGDNVIIAILDEGVDTTHVDLRDKIVSGYDATSTPPKKNQQPPFRSYHGTACAGIAAATTNNSIGVSGIACNSMIMPVRIATRGADSGWVCRPNDVALGIYYAINNGAQVLNCSWGGGTESNDVRDAIDAAIAKNVVVVLAAGNKGLERIEYPGSLAIDRDIIVVSAVNEQDEFKTFNSQDGQGWWASNYGSGLTLAAPGVNIYTTSNCQNGQPRYKLFNGTSSAAPIVSGAVALMLSANSQLTPGDIKELMSKNCDTIPETSAEKVGYGKLNIRRLVLAARGFTAQTKTLISPAAKPADASDKRN